MRCWNMNTCKKKDLFSTIKRYAISSNTVTVSVHNVRSLPSHVDNIVRDNKIINKNILGFTERQIRPSDSTCKIIGTLELFNINFNNNKKIIFKFNIQM